MTSIVVALRDGWGGMPRKERAAAGDDAASAPDIKAWRLTVAVASAALEGGKSTLSTKTVHEPTPVVAEKPAGSQTPSPT